jgi:MoxR-like ATPase
MTPRASGTTGAWDMVKANGSTVVAANGGSTIALEAVRKSLVMIRADLEGAYRERSGAIECIILATLAGCHALLVGPPGTAKSALFYSFLESFQDARKFSTLVTKFGTEDQYFGPVKLSALKLDKWERNLDGRLAAVECAFLDEVFKGSDSLLNTLLSAMNERLYNGAPIPLRMLVGASNELPQEEILAAVYDRFLMRDVVEYIESDATWMQLITSPPKYTPRAFVTLAEWDAARTAVDAVKLPDHVVRAMLQIRTELKKAGVIASDRRWIALTRVLRAAAWLDGEPEVLIDHLQILRFGLWNKPEERPSVKAVLDQLDRSHVQKAAELIDDTLRAYAARPVSASSSTADLAALTEKIKAAAVAVQAILNEARSKRVAERIQPKLAELQGAYQECKKAVSSRVAAL